jgi:hypothetical protein
VSLILLEAGNIAELDYTASEAIFAVIGAARTAGMDFAVSRLESVGARVAFERLGVIEELGPKHAFRSVFEAMGALGPQAGATTTTPGAEARPA